MSGITSHCEVLVVGAGPVGLATALSLVAQGVGVRIIDDMPARHATPRASAIHARTLELLAPFGVADRIAAYAQPIRRVQFFDAQGQEVLCRQLRAVDSQYPAQQNLQQWHVEWILAEQLLARGVEVESGTRFTALTQTDEGVVADIESAAGLSVVHCSYLVGADGARSTVRTACGTRMVGSDYADRWIGAELDIAREDVGTAVQALFAADRAALTFPLDAGLMFFAILRDDECPGAVPGPADAADVLSVYARTFGLHAHLAERVLGVRWSGHFRMHRCCVPDMRIGRAFLAGDAAHLMSAAGGYGMNAGIQDGINLAWRLAAHLRLKADASILDGYDADRREMFDTLDALSDGAHRMIVASDATVLADPALRSDEMMAMADRGVAEVAFAYTRDRTWRDEAVSGVFRAGMRVPPTADVGTGEGAVRPWGALYDGFNWTVVLAVPDRTAVRTQYIRQMDLATLTWLGARARLVVAAADAFAWNAPRPTLYLVRPDGYIAFRCDAPEGDLPDVRRLAAWLVEYIGGASVPRASPA